MAVVGDDADNIKVMAQADLKVVGVVRRGHFDRAGAEADLAVFIAHDGDLAVHDGQDTGLADEVLELFVVRVDGHAGVAHHGFRAGRGNDDIAGAVRERIADIPEMAGLVDILDLRVGEGRQAVRAPVDDAAALVNKALVVHLAEGLTHGFGAALVHGEAAARPVAADAELALLFDDAAAVLFLPRPDALQEFFAAKVIAGLALLDAQLLLDLDLGGDTGVVRTGKPQGAVALHALIAGQNVLQRRVQRVAHVELAGDVGRRHDDGIGLFVGIGFGLEAVAVQPHLVDLAFHLRRVVLLGQFFSHVDSPIETYCLFFSQFCTGAGCVGTEKVQKFLRRA